MPDGHMGFTYDRIDKNAIQTKIDRWDEWLKK
jgi:hypothetical protein